MIETFLLKDILIKKTINNKKEIKKKLLDKLENKFLVVTKT
jgi:hypothetical protein